MQTNHRTYAQNQNLLPHSEWTASTTLLYLKQSHNNYQWLNLFQTGQSYLQRQN